MEDRIHIIGRSRIPEVDSGYIMSLLGGGGHKVAASSTIKEMTLPEAKEKLIEILRNNVKPLWKAKDIMFFPVKSVDSQSAISEALSILTKYNINAMPVLSRGKVVGVITRQVAAKRCSTSWRRSPSTTTCSPSSSRWVPRTPSRR
jgi:tRNA nucleotidyltransferase (CCA-adding enzyme)